MGKKAVKNNGTRLLAKFRRFSPFFLVGENGATRVFKKTINLSALDNYAVFGRLHNAQLAAIVGARQPQTILKKQWRVGRLRKRILVNSQARQTPLCHTQ